MAIQNPNPEDLLDEHRHEIDTIDGEFYISIGVLASLLSRRNVVVDQISTIKKEHGLPARMPERYKEMRSRLGPMAVELGLKPELLLDVVDVVHEHSIDRQTDNASAPVAAASPVPYIGHGHRD